MRRDYGKRDDYFDRFVPGPAGDGSSWIGKADQSMGPGSLTSKTVTKDKGPAFNAGAGEAIGGPVDVHYTWDTISAGDWVSVSEYYSARYVFLLDCP